MITLKQFVTESNAIEGICRDPTPEELDAHEMLLDAACVDVELLAQFVDTIQPGAVLRDQVGLDVRVGNYFPPEGGAKIREELEALLAEMERGVHLNVWPLHIKYESLHPFTDGNGRSGRALWLRGIGGPEYLGVNFLQSFYYQTLSHSGYVDLERILG